jgi:hypothetical protein
MQRIPRLAPVGERRITIDSVVPKTREQFGVASKKSASRVCRRDLVSAAGCAGVVIASLVLQFAKEAGLEAE